jgi:ABC-type sugar transport system permease subunit
LVFKSKEPHTFKLFARFFLVTGLGILVIQTLVIALITHILVHRDIGVNNLLHMVHVHPLKIAFVNLNIAKLCAVSVGMVWNLSLYHFVIFKVRKPIPEDIDGLV